MPSTITITCQGGCGRKLITDGTAFDAWDIPNLCRECADRQLAEYHQQGDEAAKAKRQPEAVVAQ